MNLQSLIYQEKRYFTIFLLPAISPVATFKNMETTLITVFAAFTLALVACLWPFLNAALVDTTSLPESEPSAIPAPHAGCYRRASIAVIEHDDRPVYRCVSVPTPSYTVWSVCGRVQITDTDIDTFFATVD